MSPPSLPRTILVQTAIPDSNRVASGPVVWAFANPWTIVFICGIAITGIIMIFRPSLCAPPTRLPNLDIFNEAQDLREGGRMEGCD